MVFVHGLNVIQERSTEPTTLYTSELGPRIQIGSSINALPSASLKPDIEAVAVSTISGTGMQPGDSPFVGVRRVPPLFTAIDNRSQLQLRSLLSNAVGYPERTPFNDLWDPIAEDLGATLAHDFRNDGFLLQSGGLDSATLSLLEPALPQVTLQYLDRLLPEYLELISRKMSMSVRRIDPSEHWRLSNNEPPARLPVAPGQWFAYQAVLEHAKSEVFSRVVLGNGADELLYLLYEWRHGPALGALHPAQYIGGFMRSRKGYEDYPYAATRDDLRRRSQTILTPEACEAHAERIDRPRPSDANYRRQWAHRAFDNYYLEHFSNESGKQGIQISLPFASVSVVEGLLRLPMRWRAGQYYGAWHSKLLLREASRRLVGNAAVLAYGSLSWPSLPTRDLARAVCSLGSASKWQLSSLGLVDPQRIDQLIKTATDRHVRIPPAVQLAAGTEKWVRAFA